ncbi:transmembrane protein 244 [Carcharodon carcharias]|uniref:transmembrane protein 244 n=1 Tax=Carcharodon carcharias TaxID=13397 RepID=UPI001B7EAD73|nr:transmembrane protein 244 [Carcharodon carcharias]
MAVKFKVTDTKTVLLQLLVCLMTFYAVYYITSSISFGAFRLQTYDYLIPFDFKTEPSCPSSKYMANLVSMEMTYFVCGLLFAVVVKEWVWDYAITVTLIHIAVTSTGTVDTCKLNISPQVMGFNVQNHISKISKHLNIAIPCLVLIRYYKLIYEHDTEGNHRHLCRVVIS